jgi:effector-binding domain-containing protein
MAKSSFEIEEKSTKRVRVATLRMRARYPECIRVFGLIASRFAKQVSGKPILLHHDAEFDEDDIDCEACIPIRGGYPIEGIGVRELPDHPCVALVHQGPYHSFGESYARMMEYVRKKGYVVELPIRQVCLDGEATVSGCDVRNSRTEIQVPIARVAQACAMRAAHVL